jgi:hypothetical protein
MKKTNFLKHSLTALIVLFIMAELVLRFYYGFCDAVLMKEDLAFEYIAQPSQDRFRFRKHIHYNEFSMRSDSVRKNAVKILGFGDSVINGGTLTDQDSLATTKLSNSLSSLLDKPVQVLNISAGSWGPDNCAAYLQKYGDFNARMILLVVSSHDAYDNMTFEKIVGVNPAFPDKQYFLATAELVGRYVLPKFFKQEGSNELGINKQKAGAVFNPGFEKIYSYAKEKNIPLLIYLHPEKNEVENKAYNKQGEEIIQFAEANGITLLKELELGIIPADYRDEIHPNAAGQAKMFSNLFKQIKSMISAGQIST